MLPTNARQFIAFLSESKLTIVLHNVPALRIAVGVLIASVLRCEVLFERGRLIAVHRDLEGPVIGRDIESFAMGFHGD
jgi:hypothetical protein